MLDKKTILITGGTGSFGNAFIKTVLKKYRPKKVKKKKEMGLIRKKIKGLFE